MPYISIKCQKLLVFLDFKNDFISFKEQEIFNNQLAFNRVIKKMLKCKWIRENLFDNYKYKITLGGMKFVDKLKEFNSTK